MHEKFSANWSKTSNLHSVRHLDISRLIIIALADYRFCFISAEIFSIAFCKIGIFAFRVSYIIYIIAVTQFYIFTT